MIKKVISIVISLCLIFSISVMAENENIVVGETAENEISIYEKNKQNPEENPQFEGRMPAGMKGDFSGSMQKNSAQTEEAETMSFWEFVKTYSTPIASVILLALAFIFVIFYRRKNY